MKDEGLMKRPGYSDGETGVMDTGVEKQTHDVGGSFRPSATAGSLATLFGSRGVGGSFAKAINEAKKMIKEHLESYSENIGCDVITKKVHSTMDYDYFLFHMKDMGKVYYTVVTIVQSGPRIPTIDEQVYQQYSAGPEQCGLPMS